MTGQLDLWAGREVAPGHRVTIHSTTTPALTSAHVGKCECGWRVGPYSVRDIVINRALQHGQFALRVQSGGPIDG